MEHQSNQPDRRTNLLSIVLVGILLILWCLLSINPTANVHAIQIVETVIIALLIAISAYSMGDGSRNFGIVGIIIGLSLSYIPFYLSLTLPAAVFLERSTQTVITLLSAASGGIALFSTVALGLWISSHIPNRYRRLSKYLAFALAILVIFLWLTLVLVVFHMLDSYPFGPPSGETVFLVILILTSSLFVPRRQGLDLFYFVLSLVLAYWGAMTLMTARHSYYELIGHIYSVIGTILVALFAFPLGARKLEEDRHPEHTIFIALPLWFFVEVLSRTMTTFPFTIPRVIMIGFVLYTALTDIKTEHGVFSMVGTSIGVVITYVGLFLWYPSYLLVQTPSGLSPSVGPFASVFVSMFGIVLLLYCIVNLGAFLKKKISTNPTRGLILSRTGILLIIAGIIAGVSDFYFLNGPFYLLDTLCLLFVGLGSMLVNLKQTQSWKLLSLLGLVLAIAVLLGWSFASLRFVYYPSMAVMIFFGVQYIGTGPKQKPLGQEQPPLDTLDQSTQSLPPEIEPNDDSRFSQESSDEKTGEESSLD